MNKGIRTRENTTDGEDRANNWESVEAMADNFQSSPELDERLYSNREVISHPAPSWMRDYTLIEK